MTGEIPPGSTGQVPKVPLPPPKIAFDLFDLGQIRDPFIGAVRLYTDSIHRHGRPYHGWEDFERFLAYSFGILVRFLAALPRDDVRCRLLEFFLERMNFENKRGRGRKARGELKWFQQGLEMTLLWKADLLPAWNMKRSLERTGGDLSRLQQFGQDVAKVVTARKATPESSIARLYAKRSNIRFGTARNALRKYKASAVQSFTPQV